MVLFDRFDESNFDIDPAVLDIEPVTTSELRKEYAELGLIKTWPEGEQTARKDGTIVSRSYKTLEFNLNAKDFDLVDAGYEDNDRYGGRYYWRVIHEFTETERYSSNIEEFGNFKVWEISTNQYQLEITYDNKPTIIDPKDEDDPDDDIVANLTWIRPTVEAPLETIPPVLETLPTYACPLDEPEAPDEETGESAAFLVPEVIDEDTDPNDIMCRRWASLPKPYRLVWDAGKSLGAYVANVDLSFDRVYVSNTIDLSDEFKVPLGSGTSSIDPYRMEYRYLVFEWDDPGRDNLTTMSVTFLANELYRYFLPLISDTDPEIKEHFENTPYIAHATLGEATRYKPPGEYNFPDGFWNDTDNKELNEYGTRITVLPGVVN